MMKNEVTDKLKVMISFPAMPLQVLGVEHSGADILG